jgi:hypothetical protein
LNLRNLMRRFTFSLILLLFAASVHAQQTPIGFDLTNYGVRIEPDKRLIVVLAALEMARTTTPDGKEIKLIETPLSAKGAEFRKRLLAENADLDPELRGRISSFVERYKKRNPGQTDAEVVSPFISMAYTLTPVPDLSDPIITTDLPGNLLDVLDFAPLVRDFYRRSKISGKLDSYLAEYRSDADAALRPSAKEMVGEILGYLHTRPMLTISEKVKVETTRTGSKQRIQQTEAREHERHFYIVPEKLAPKGNINFLNIRDDYYAIVPPDTDLSFSEARRAFLQFVIDPIILGTAKEMTPMRDWAKPVLDELRKTNPIISPDTFLAVSESLVAASDVRQAQYLKEKLATDQARARQAILKSSEEKQAVYDELTKFKKAQADEATLQLYEAYQKGAVFAFYFAEQLKGVEESGFDIAASVKDMVASFDAAREKDRVAASAEARARAVAAREARRKNTDTVVAVTESPVTTRLRDIQKTIEAKNYEKANTDLKQLLTQYPAEPRIYYNIGRVAGLTAVGLNDADAVAQRLVDAKNAYGNVLRTATPATDPALLSLTYVALGRIYEFENQNDYAIKLYDRAIQLGEVSGGALQAAMDAKARLIKPN